MKRIKSQPRDLEKRIKTSSFSLNSSSNNFKILVVNNRAKFRRIAICFLYIAKIRLNTLKRLVEEALDPQRRAGQTGRFSLTECQQCLVLSWNVDSTTRFCRSCKGLFHYASQRSLAMTRADDWKRGFIEPKLLLHKWLKNRGRCEISDHILPFASGTSWQVSPDRIESSLPYSIENIRLVALLFNVIEDKSINCQKVASQWSREKFLKAKTLAIGNYDLTHFLSNLQKAKSTPQSYALKPKTFIPSLVEVFHCSICRQCKPVDQFPSCDNQQEEKSSHCNECDSFVFHIARKCKNKGISLTQALEQLERQAGRCSVSNIPMSYNPTENWCSKLRKARPQEPWDAPENNLEFICAEFRLCTSLPDSNQVIKLWTPSLFHQLWGLE